MRLILVVALLCFLSPISYAMSVIEARIICVSIADVGHTLMALRENGAAKHVLLDKAADIYVAGDMDASELRSWFWAIEYVYDSDETHETIQGPMFRACMKELGYSGA